MEFWLLFIINISNIQYTYIYEECGFNEKSIFVVSKSAWIPRVLQRTAHIVTEVENRWTVQVDLTKEGDSSTVKGEN